LQAILFSQFFIHNPVCIYLRRHAFHNPPAQLIVFRLIAQFYLVWYTNLDCLHCVFPPSCHFSLVGPNIVFSTLFYNSRSVCSSLIVTSQVSSPYKITNRIFLYINNLITNKLHQYSITGHLHISAKLVAILRELQHLEKYTACYGTCQPYKLQ
jgi:hypothetical protein